MRLASTTRKTKLVIQQTEDTHCDPNDSKTVCVPASNRELELKSLLRQAKDDVENSVQKEAAAATANKTNKHKLINTTHAHDDT